jgi:RND family efflux transporter MFP subunit
MRRPLLISIAAVLLAQGFAQGCAEAPPTPEIVEELHSVVTVPAVAESYAAPVIAVGRLEGENETVLSFKIGGLVSRVPVDAGHRVRRGQLLASLDTAEIGAEVSRAEAALAKAERDKARIVRLFDDGAASAANRDDTATAVDVARADLQIATFNAEHARIAAPREGIILSRLVEPNEMVAPGQPILQMQGGSNNWVVRVGLPERDAVRVRVGDSATVQLSAYDDASIQGTVTELAPTAQAGTGTFSAKLSLASTELRLMSGLAARVEIAPSDRRTLVFVPIGALVEADREKGFVFVLNEDKTARRQVVEIGLIRKEEVGLKRGVSEGEQIIIEGASYLSSGESVRLAAREPVR